MFLANGLIKGTPHQKDFPEGVDHNWYYRFRTSEHASELKLAAANPHEENRQQWCTAVNARQHFAVLSDIIVQSGIGKINPKYESNTPLSEPVLIQKPTRIVSFDETHLFLTGKENVGRKKMLVVKGDGRRNNKDLVVNKCSANLTQVGGSDGSGRALPQFNIVPALSLDPLITRDSVTSDYQDEHGEYRPAVWTCNESGGMTDCMGPAYLDKVIIPCLKPTMEDPIILICDGHGSHLTYEFLTKCHGGGATPRIYLVLRPPHTSHVLQVEDVENFSVYKPLVAKQREIVFMKRIISKTKNKNRNLNLLDTNAISAAAWEKAFSQERNLKGWASCGLVPFSRKPMWDLHNDEQAAARDLGTYADINIDYSQVSFSDMLNGSSDEEESGEEDDPEFGGAKRRRLTSAQMWALKGGCTGEEALGLMKAKHDESKAREAERQKRRSDRDAEEAKRDEEAKRAALPILESIEAGGITVERLTKVQLCSLLVFFAAVPVGMRTKKKEDLRALVKALPRIQVLAAAAPPLPPPQQAPPPPPSSP